MVTMALLSVVLSQIISKSNLKQMTVQTVLLESTRMQVPQFQFHITFLTKKNHQSRLGILPQMVPALATRKATL